MRIMFSNCFLLSIIFKEVSDLSIEIISATHNGLDGMLVSVEVDISRGMPSFSIIVYNSKINWSLAMIQFSKDG